MNYSRFNNSVIIIDGNSNSNATQLDDVTTSPYDENIMMGLAYFLVSLLFGLPILMILLCVYRMRGDPPCDNLKQVFCCEFC